MRISFIESLQSIESLVRLSVELHNLNAQAQRHHELSLVQWLVLRKIWCLPGVSASSLAQLSGLHPSTLTPTLQRLETASFVHIFERPSDLRQKMLVLSSQGFVVCVQFERVLRRILKDVEMKEGRDPIETTRLLTAALALSLQDV